MLSPAAEAAAPGQSTTAVKRGDYKARNKSGPPLGGVGLSTCVTASKSPPPCGEGGSDLAESTTPTGE
eukprot:10647894-Alexandrium_andersonii.AAC.1